MTTQIPPKSLHVPTQLGTASVTYGDQNFSVTDPSGNVSTLQRCDISKELRGVDPITLRKMLDVGYLTLGKVGNDYAISYYCRGPGGGPIAGAIAYWATKTFCYGVAVAGAGTAVVATGGALGAATGAIAAGATASASAGATVVGGAIAGAGLAGEAATATAGVITGAGSIAGAAAAVESGALAMSAFFAALPIP